MTITIIKEQCFYCRYLFFVFRNKVCTDTSTPDIPSYVNFLHHLYTKGIFTLKMNIRYSYILSCLLIIAFICFQIIHAYLGIHMREKNDIQPNQVFVLPSFLILKWMKADYSSWTFSKVIGLYL